MVVAASCSRPEQQTRRACALLQNLAPDPLSRHLSPPPKNKHTHTHTKNISAQITSTLHLLPSLGEERRAPLHRPWRRPGRRVGIHGPRRQRLLGRLQSQGHVLLGCAGVARRLPARPPMQWRLPGCGVVGLWGCPNVGETKRAEKGRGEEWRKGGEPTGRDGCAPRRRPGRPSRLV